MTATIRPLAPSEKGFAYGRVYIGFTVRTQGELDLEAVTAAYDALRRRYPVLAARIEKTDGGFALTESAGPSNGPVVSAGFAESVFSEVNPDQTRELSALWVRREGDLADVTLFTHHSVIDLTILQGMTAQLWEYYTDAVTGGIGAIEPLPYPVSVEEILAARGIQKPDMPALTGPAARSAMDAPQFVRDPSRLHLTAEATTALTELGRRADVSMYGLVSAALLLAEAEFRGTEPTSLLYMFPVSLRDRLTPPVGPTEGTNVMGFTGYMPAGEAATSVVGMGRAIVEQIRAGLDSGAIQQSPLLIPEGSEGVVPPIPGLVTSTNWGRVPEFRTPEGLRAEDFRATLAIAPEPEPAEGELGAPPNYIISAYGGRLSIQVDLPTGTVEDQRQRLKILEKVLHEAVSAR